MKAILSTCFARFGKSDETHFPQSPYCFHSKGDFINGPILFVKNPVFLSRFGNGLPSHLMSSGLQSHVSTWLGPPLTKIQMTALALALKCGFLGARGFSDDLASSPLMDCLESRSKRAREPIPEPQR